MHDVRARIVSAYARFFPCAQILQAIGIYRDEIDYCGKVQVSIWLYIIIEEVFNKEFVVNKDLIMLGP